jgi:hypothetical protein
MKNHLTNGFSKLSYNPLRQEVTATRGNLSAMLPAECLFLAHVGFRSLGSIAKEVSPATRSMWDEEFGRAWRKTDEACRRLANVLNEAIKKSCLSGICLNDTMRKGSDFWRPGKLVSDVVELLPNSVREHTCMGRRDILCPPKELLHSFLNNDGFSFSSYEEKYAAYLVATSGSFVAACDAVFSLASGQLPIYCCTDPYIPGYRRTVGRLTELELEVRSTEGAIVDGNSIATNPHSIEIRADYRTLGCHRLRLVHEIATIFHQIGIPSVNILEPNQTTDECGMYPLLLRKSVV